jgi:hypothetical protein
MVLLWAVAAGLATGLGRARSQKVRYEAPVLQHLWLVFIAFLPQFLVVYLPVRDVMSEASIAFCLILSQLLLCGFAFLNRHYMGMRILMIGAALNGLVMIVNGGFMPISPQTAARLVPQDILLGIASGSRFGSKDILLLPEHTRLEWLADRFLLPAWLPYQVAFSLGDIFIAAGVFWLLARQKPIEQGYTT